MTEQDHLALARSDDIEGLERAWQESLSDPGDVGSYERTVNELCDNDAVGVALNLTVQMVDALAERERHADAARLATVLVHRGVHNESMARRLLELIEVLHSGEEWYPLMLQISGLSTQNIHSDAFREFERARHYTPGHVLYHRAGWGEGVIQSLDIESRELTVQFASGSTKVFPLQSALESLRPLEGSDLRAMRLLRPEECQRLAEQEPAVLIRLVAKMFRGKATSTQLKAELSPSIIATKRWATFWKKAKTAAATDPWLQIEGSKTRPTFVLRKKPLSLADEASRSLHHAANLGEALAVCREYFSRDLDADARSVILDLAQRIIETAVQKGEESHADLLDGILMLEEMGRETSVSAAQELRAMLLDEDGSFHAERFDNIANKGSREHAVQLLNSALGEHWADYCVESITRFPRSVAEPVVDILQEAGQARRLVNAWAAVAPYPKRFPELSYALGRLFADGVFDGEPQKPDQISVARVMLHLCRIVSKERRADSGFARLQTRLATLLVGRHALLHGALQDIGREDLTAFLGIAERGGQEFPQDVMDAIIRVVSSKYPDITSRADRPFWQDDNHVYVTSEGHRRQLDEHRVLVEEKIPTNQKHIQQAASYGDLSENSEWEAAMEEQRKLTGRAEEMSHDLRRVRLIEDQEIPDGVVAPGTRVSYTILETGEQRTFRILGPWDCVTEDTINYRAPIAQHLLGKTVGDEGEIQVPEGSQTFRIDEIERIV